MDVKKQFVSWEEFGKDLHDLSHLIGQSQYFKYVYGVPRGGLVVATYLSHHLGLEFLESFPHRSMLGETLVADDLVDTGKTMRDLRDIHGHFHSAVVYYKPHSIWTPAFHIKETLDWIVFPYERDDERPNREMYSHL